MSRLTTILIAVMSLALLLPGCGKSKTSQELKLLKSESAEERENAILHLGQLARTEEAVAAIPHLVKALDDAEANVRRAAATVLGTFRAKAKPAVEKLAQLAGEDGDVPVRQAALLALQNIGAAERMSEPCAEMLGSDDEETRKFAALMLAQTPGAAKKAVTGLTKALKDQNDDVRMYAAQALGSAGADASSAVPALKTALQDKVDYVREAAKEALSKVQ